MFRAYDYMMRSILRKFGMYAGLRFCKNLGIPFEETYFMMFGKLPTRFGGE